MTNLQPPQYIESVTIYNFPNVERDKDRGREQPATKSFALKGGDGNDDEEQKQRQYEAGFCAVSALLARDTKVFIDEEDDAYLKRRRFGIKAHKP